MRHTPWALALLALSLPAPALSDPLHRLSIRDAIWNRTFGSPVNATRPWHRDDPEFDDDAFLPGPSLGWRQRAAYGPSVGYSDDNLPVYGYAPGYGPAPGAGDWRGRRTPLAVIPPGAAQPLRRCGPAPALVGAAIGGGLGAALSDGARSRQWALPIGATVGGLLGGVLAGC